MVGCEIQDYITVTYAQLERGILGERVKAGMDGAKREGRGLEGCR